MDFGPESEAHIYDMESILFVAGSMNHESPGETSVGEAADCISEAPQGTLVY